MEKINIAEKLRVFDKYWQSKSVGEFNGQQVKLIKMKGEFEWHYHQSEEEFYLVLKGILNVRFQDKEVSIKDGEFFILPKGSEHRISAVEEVQMMVIEPRSTLNTSKNDHPAGTVQELTAD